MYQHHQNTILCNTQYGLSVIFYDDPLNVHLIIDCSLVTPYGDIDLGQQWIRQWFAD